ncbi:glycosyltransferase involved in cell wall biosynthesis [Kineococcus xinjiangensis]|uniref:Glycosyltransferase involved in cell wall biosynthesis n=1 Tax=Kineococcus xinjiangensis TaxID=512762 RepID=A0A2S6IE50_9ACTN|nr:GT4 family glycosyltransferase PelF [Kineococcus xinjiangensis]PPK92479.1 glycosyltransferase involved in cell wall biosynthesis [Kineococcus xinjiangensis]
MSVPAPSRRTAGPRPRVVLLTEGTYPFVMGGVSTWCDLLLGGLPDIDWQVFALTAGVVDEPQFDLPPNARLAGHLHLWGSGHPPRRPGRGRRSVRRTTLAAELVTGLFGWDCDPLDLVPALVWCRENPDRVLPMFRREETWDHYLAALTSVLAEDHEEAGTPPQLDLNRAIELFQTLAWVARTAAEPTPSGDVSLVTAAAWSGIPAAVDKALLGRPVVLSEHGIYVRESYLAAVRSTGAPAAARWVNTRLARGLTRLTYAVADVVCPVADANAPWEEALGVSPDRIVTIPNGVPSPGLPQPARRSRTVVSVGRLDPLKDVHTMLRVAHAVRRRVPDVTFLHYGPVPRGQEDYARTCHALHAELGLGDSFRFMGPTKDPTGVMRDADVVLMTSISEGFPMSVLEALSQARPVVTTLVGGVLDGMRGAGMTAPPGDVHGLADAVTALLVAPDFAESLGRRGHERVVRLFGQERCLDGYRVVLHALARPQPQEAAPWGRAEGAVGAAIPATAREQARGRAAERASLTRARLASATRRGAR